MRTFANLLIVMFGIMPSAAPPIFAQGSSVKPPDLSGFWERKDDTG